MAGASNFSRIHKILQGNVVHFIYFLQKSCRDFSKSNLQILAVAAIRKSGAGCKYFSEDKPIRV
jgi:hypothetical protein